MRPIVPPVGGGLRINRWLLKSVVESPFMLGHFNDLLLIPAALPVVLGAQRLVGFRSHDFAPSWMEIGSHLAVWSLICEFVGPVWLRRGIADLWDDVMYILGSGGAGLWWNRPIVPHARFWAALH